MHETFLGIDLIQIFLRVHPLLVHHVPGKITAWGTAM